MAVNVVGIVALCVFYIAVMVFGIIAAKRFKANNATSTDIAMVAGRNLGPVVGMFTMTATYTGGAYICGVAEGVAKVGLAWTLVPFAVIIGLSLGGIFFAGQMRAKNYLTMLDPFQEKLGSQMTAMLFISAVCVDVFWSASILSALGASLSVIINLDRFVAIILSTIVATSYTLFGQMVAVAYTDIIQLLFLFGGLVISVPFAMTNEAVGDISTTSDKWLGTISPESSAMWLDLAGVLILGAIPWQSYFQRVLSSRTVRQAQMVSFAGGFGMFIMGIPSFFIGALATVTNWNETGLGYNPLAADNETEMILPYALHYLTPEPVAIIGLSAIAAAVMSSMDSAILGCSSMATHNIYSAWIRKQASERELLWVQRASVVIVACITAAIAIFVKTVIGLFILAADLGYVIIFPQLACAVHFQQTNSYGALVGYIIGTFLRIGGGEKTLTLNPLILYPWYDEESGDQLFPFKTFAMCITLITIVGVSVLTNVAFEKGIIPLKYDFLGVVERERCLREAREKPKDLKVLADDNGHIKHEVVASM